MRSTKLSFFFKLFFSNSALHSRNLYDIFLRYGFVDFESEESCKAVKDAMEDCEIDGSKVTVAYANPRGVKGVSEGLAGRPTGQKAAARGGHKDKGGKAGRGKGGKGKFSRGGNRL